MPYNLDNLCKSGFCFLKSDGKSAIYENKFTGLWLLLDLEKHTYEVMEEAWA